MAKQNFSGSEEALDETQASGVSFESQNRKWESREEAKDLIDAIDNCKQLIYLNLEGNMLNYVPWALIPIREALRKHPELQKALFKNITKGVDKRLIAYVLHELGLGIRDAGAHLTGFDCSDNEIGIDGDTGLFQLLKSPSCYSLQELKLNNCRLSSRNGAIVAEALFECYENSVQAGTPLQLKVFMAGGNRLRNGGARSFAQVFRKVRTLEQVWMPENFIKTRGIMALSKALKVNPNMRSLNLSGNILRAGGVKTICDALTHMQNLTELNFGHCSNEYWSLKTSGAIALGSALEKGHLALESLILDHNRIGPNGGYAIANAMRNKERLQNLNLNGNQFGEKAREKIKKILDEAQRLHALGLLDEDKSDNESEENNESLSSDNDDDDIIIRPSGTKSRRPEWESDVITELNDCSVHFVGNAKKSNTVDEFFKIAHPTSKQFEALEESDKLQAFRDYLKNIPAKDYLTQLLFTIVKLSAISKDNKQALQITIELHKDCFVHAEKVDEVDDVCGFFRKQFGLVKFRKIHYGISKLMYDTSACQYALQNAIESKVFSEHVEMQFNNSFESNRPPKTPPLNRLHNMTIHMIPFKRRDDRIKW